MIKNLLHFFFEKPVVSEKNDPPFFPQGGSNSLNKKMAQAEAQVRRQAEARRQRRCGFCRNVGHDQRNCAVKRRNELGYPRMHAANEMEIQRLHGAHRLITVEALRNMAPQDMLGRLLPQQHLVRQAPQDLIGRPLPLPQQYQVRPAQAQVPELELRAIAALPILRETAVETDECPICIETLGETGKTVLKCGHTVCVSCFLQQVLRAMATKRKNDCTCPICRVNYIM